MEWPLPAPTVERTPAIALKMSLLIFANAKRKFAFLAGTITTHLKAPTMQVPGEALLITQSIRSHTDGFIKLCLVAVPLTC